MLNGTHGDDGRESMLNTQILLLSSFLSLTCLRIVESSTTVALIGGKLTFASIIKKAFF